MKPDGKKEESGFSLLEMLLAVAVFGMISLLMIDLMRNWAEDESARGAGEYFKVINDAHSVIAEKIEYFDAVYKVVEANAGVLEIPVLGDPVALGVPFTLEMGGMAGSVRIPGSPYIGSEFAAKNPFRSDMIVVVRIADDMLRDDDERMLEFFVASRDRVNERIVRRTALSMGGSGGYISAIGELGGSCVVSCDLTIRGAYGDWQIAATDLTGTNWFNTINLNRADTLNGSYLVNYSYVTESQVAGDYLYRIPYPEMPELNRMSQTMDFADKNIVGADNIFTNVNTVTQLTDVRGSAFINNLEMNGAQMTVQKDMAVGELGMWKLHESHPSLEENLSQKIIVEGTVIVSDATSFDMSSLYTLNADEINVSNIVTNTASISELEVSGSSNASSLTGGAINSASLTAGELNVTESIVGNVTAAEINTINFKNTVFFSSDSASVSGNMDISRLSECLSGCVY